MCTRRERSRVVVLRAPNLVEALLLDTTFPGLRTRTPPDALPVGVSRISARVQRFTRLLEAGHREVPRFSKDRLPSPRRRPARGPEARMTRAMPRLRHYRRPGIERTAPCRPRVAHRPLIGTLLPPRRPGSLRTADRSREPEVEDDHVGTDDVPRGRARAPIGRDIDLLSAAPRRFDRAPADLRLVLRPSTRVMSAFTSD